MPMHAPTQSLCITREGKRLYPEIGVPFDFTDDEVAQAPAGSLTDVATVSLSKSEVVTKTPAAKTAAKKNAAGTADL